MIEPETAYTNRNGLNHSIKFYSFFDYHYWDLWIYWEYVSTHLFLANEEIIMNEKIVYNEYL